jgi:2-amino-4-hydroxy-6-hydroxymethyldihydropteridine diphosphokinase
MDDVYIGLGSNMGASVANLRRAVLAIDGLTGTDVRSASHVYESEPWGLDDQPAFVNAVVSVRTTLRADQLLGYLQEIERDLGRRRGTRYGPRAIDLDLLLFGDEEWRTEQLTVPHPRMAERDFVLTPLLAISPDATWPDGSPILKGSRLVGAVTADLGRLPDADPDWYVWEARDDAPTDSAPVGQVAPWDPGQGWVEVARARAAGGEIAVLESKLRALGIPFELSHREFGDGIGSLAGPAAILVPAPRASEARMALGLSGVPQAGAPREPAPARPAWFRMTLRVFGWMFAIYWIVRILARDGF